MIKLLGIFLISSSTAIYGNLLLQKYKTRIKQRDEILLLLAHIKSGVKYSSHSLKDLYKSFDFAFLNKPLELDEQEAVKIKCIFQNLEKGKSISDELQLLENAECQLKATFDKSNEIDKNKAVLYRKLSIIVSITLAIILF